MAQVYLDCESEKTEENLNDYSRHEGFMKVRGVVKGGEEGPGPLIFGTRESKCVFYKGTIKVCVSCS